MTLRNVIVALRRAGIEPTGRELAEAIWLAQHMTPPPPFSEPAPLQPVTGHGAGNDEAAEQEGLTAPPPEAIPVATPVAGSAAGPVAAFPVRSPGPPGLPHTREIQRALRPLRKRVPSRRRQVIDEAATATLIASTNVWAPALVPARERNFELVLAVDSAPSMRLWQHLEADLAAALTQTGAFRNVRFCQLLHSREGISVRMNPSGVPRNPREFIDGAGRRLFIVLTDGAAKSWHDGSGAILLSQWARTGPTAVLQPLPEEMWIRTGLPGMAARVSSVTAGAPNIQLKVKYRRRRRLDHIPVPILGIEPRAIQSWARLVASPSSEVSLAVAGVASARYGAPARGAGENETKPLQRFRATASPQAHRLAICLSVVPLALPIMRLVQHVVIPGTRPSVLAEVILGGILVRTGDDSYEFVDGAREALLDELRRSEAMVVLSAVSTFLAEHAGSVGPRFPALAVHPDGYVAAEAEAFGWVPPAAARRLGLLDGRDDEAGSRPVPQSGPDIRTAQAAGSSLPEPSPRTRIRMVLMGPPGAGKGTQAEFIAAHLGIPKVSTGDMFKANVLQGTPLGIEAKRYMDAGRLVPDELTIKMVRERLAEPDVAHGFLLDGFPQTTPQAAALDQLLADLNTPIDLTMELVIDDEEVTRRLSGRRTCRGCGKIWHVEFDPPHRENVCDRCGGELFQRDDDKPETIAARLRAYAEKTAPLVDYYGAQGKLVGIDATGPVEDVTVRAIDTLRLYGGREMPLSRVERPYRERNPASEDETHAEYRLLMAVDLVNFSQQARGTQSRWRDSMWTAVAVALEDVGIEPVVREDRGDGLLMLVSPTVHRNALAGHFIRTLKYAVEGEDVPAMRMRVALHQGTCQRGANGWSGSAINTVSRLLDALQLRDLQQTTEPAVAVIISDPFYQDLIRQDDRETRPPLFRMFEVNVGKDRRERAWVIPDRQFGLDRPPEPRPGTPH